MQKTRDLPTKMKIKLIMLMNKQMKYRNYVLIMRGLITSLKNKKYIMKIKLNNKTLYMKSFLPNITTLKKKWKIRRMLMAS